VVSKMTTWSAGRSSGRTLEMEGALAGIALIPRCRSNRMMRRSRAAVISRDRPASRGIASWRQALSRATAAPGHWREACNSSSLSHGEPQAEILGGPTPPLTGGAARTSVGVEHQRVQRQDRAEGNQRAEDHIAEEMPALIHAQEPDQN